MGEETVMWQASIGFGGAAVSVSVDKGIISSSESGSGSGSGSGPTRSRSSLLLCRQPSRAPADATTDDVDGLVARRPPVHRFPQGRPAPALHTSFNPSIPDLLFFCASYTHILDRFEAFQVCSIRVAWILAGHLPFINRDRCQWPSPKLTSRPPRNRPLNREMMKEKKMKNVTAMMRF
uniref:Uncharacterized protein n=1 Tax=Oryza meridionalis TaxID=40149 RepID=A0A0E0E1F1_9ORYZ